MLVCEICLRFDCIGYVSFTLYESHNVKFFISNSTIKLHYLWSLLPSLLQQLKCKFKFNLLFFIIEFALFFLVCSNFLPVLLTLAFVKDFNTNSTLFALILLDVCPIFQLVPLHSAVFLMNSQFLRFKEGLKKIHKLSTHHLFNSAIFSGFLLSKSSNTCLHYLTIFWIDFEIVFWLPYFLLFFGYFP